MGNTEQLIIELENSSTNFSSILQRYEDAVSLLKPSVSFACLSTARRLAGEVVIIASRLKSGFFGVTGFIRRIRLVRALRHARERLIQWLYSTLCKFVLCEVSDNG